MKNIVDGSESIVKQYISVSNVNFYKPFNVVSLAVIMGNDEQRNKAKKWVSQLDTIFTNKKLTKAKKAELILEHMEQVEQEREFGDFLLMHEKYGLNYQFEPSWKRVSRKFGTAEKIIILVIEVGLFIVTLVQLILR